MVKNKSLCLLLASGSYMVNWSPTLQTAVSDLVSNFSFGLYGTLVCCTYLIGSWMFRLNLSFMLRKLNIQKNLDICIISSIVLPEGT